MDAEITNPKAELPSRLYHVYLRDGRTFAVTAATWSRQLQPDDLIKFFDALGAEEKNVFLRAPDTSAVAPDSSAFVAPPIAALQSDVKVLTSRLDVLESNLPDMIARAVTGAVVAAFAERGM